MLFDAVKQYTGFVYQHGKLWNQCSDSRELKNRATA